ncbi:MAG TPA: tetratricopeptide repeat protein, partial [Methanospirillum sp.]|nr:tetratricopeptide repeat protein [Methanospirillum sp.]
IWINKGRAEYYAGNMSDAIQSADTALRLEKDNIDAMVLKANGLVDSGKNEEAQALTDRVLELDPQNQEIWYVQGTIQFLNKEYAKAIESMEKDLKQNPDRICSYFYLSMSQKEISGSEAVIAVLDRMTKQFPTDNRYANAEVGNLLIQLVKKTPGTYLHDTVPLWEWYFSYKDQGDAAYYQEYLGERWSSVRSALEEYIYGSKGGYDDIETIMEPLLKKADPLTTQETEKIIDIYDIFSYQAVDDGRYFEAVKSAEKIINITPQEESEILQRTWYTKAFSLNVLEKYGEALEAAEIAIQLSPNASYAWDEKGNALVGLDRYEEALEVYEQEILMAPESGGGWYGKGSALYNLKKYEEALEPLNKAIDLGYNSASRIRNKALKELGMEIPTATPRANETADEPLNGTPISGEALYDALDAAKEQKDWNEVMNLTEDSVQSEYPREYLIPVYRADALIELGHIDEALDTYDKSAFVAKTWGDQYDIGYALSYKGDALFSLGRYDEAFELYSQYAEQVNSAGFYSAMGGASSYGPADAYINDSPEDFETWGDILYTEGRYTEASEAFTQSIETGTYIFESNPWFALARTLEKMEKPTEAKEAYKKASNSTMAERLMWWIDEGIKGGDDPQVKDAAITYALTLNPESSYIWQMKGWYLEGLGQYEEAIKAYAMAIEYEKNPDNIELYQEAKQTILEKLESGPGAANLTS